MSVSIQLSSRADSLNDSAVAALRNLAPTLIGDVECDTEINTDTGDRWAALTARRWSGQAAFQVTCDAGRFQLWDLRRNGENDVPLEDSADLPDILTAITAELGLKSSAA